MLDEHEADRVSTVTQAGAKEKIGPYLRIESFVDEVARDGRQPGEVEPSGAATTMSVAADRALGAATTGAAITTAHPAVTTASRDES